MNFAQHVAEERKWFRLTDHLVRVPLPYDGARRDVGGGEVYRVIPAVHDGDEVDADEGHTELSVGIATVTGTVHVQDPGTAHFYFRCRWTHDFVPSPISRSTYYALSRQEPSVRRLDDRHTVSMIREFDCTVIPHPDFSS